MPIVNIGGIPVRIPDGISVIDNRISNEEKLLNKIGELPANKAAELLSDLVGFNSHDPIITNYCEKWLAENPYILHGAELDRISEVVSK